MCRPTYRDAVGFLIAALETTGPVLACTWVTDNRPKVQPLGLIAYLLPAAVSLSMTVLSSGAVMVVAGREAAGRVQLHALFGVVAAAALVIGYCGWWGEWCHQYAERFRG